MTSLSANAFLVTTSFVKSLNFDFIEKMKKYFQKCLMVYCIRDKEDDNDRLQYQVWYDKNRSIDDVRKTFKRIIMRNLPEDEYEFPACLRVVCCYNENFYNEYRQKDKKEIIYNSVKDKKISEFIYSNKKNEEKDKKTLFEKLKEACKDKTSYDDIGNSCISYCIESGDCPRRDTLKNIIWWIWLANNPDNHHSLNVLDNLKEERKEKMKKK